MFKNQKGFSAIVTMVEDISNHESTLELPDWSDDFLAFVVRELFPSVYTESSIISGYIEKGEELVISSDMPKGGVIISDGMIDRGIQFNSGTTVSIKVSEKQVNLIN